MNRLPPLPLMLLIAIPATSVVLGIIMMIVAFSGVDQEIPIEQAPLSKVSWQSGQSAEKLSLEEQLLEEPAASEEPGGLIIREPIRDD